MNDVEAPADGRVARRERNINSVLDVVLEMFAEESLFPTIEQVAKRSGLSLRSLYRYFADPAELLEAVIVRSREQVAEAVLLPAIGQGFVADRIDDFVACGSGCTKYRDRPFGQRWLMLPIIRGWQRSLPRIVNSCAISSCCSLRRNSKGSAPKNANTF